MRPATRCWRLQPRLNQNGLGQSRQLTAQHLHLSPSRSPQPYAPRNQVLAAALDSIEFELASTKHMLEDCAVKGKLTAFMQVGTHTAAACPVW